MIGRVLGVLAVAATLGLSTMALMPEPAPADTMIVERPRATSTWNLERAVQQALAAELPGEKVAFALDSSQSTPLPGGGRRVEGFGIGLWGEGEARFVTFTLALSPDGEALAFDYGAEMAGSEASMIAAY